MPPLPKAGRKGRNRPAVREHRLEIQETKSSSPTPLASLAALNWVAPSHHRSEQIWPQEYPGKRYWLQKLSKYVLSRGCTCSPRPQSVWNGCLCLGTNAPCLPEQWQSDRRPLRCLRPGSFLATSCLFSQADHVLTSNSLLRESTGGRSRASPHCSTVCTTPDLPNSVDWK